MKRSEGIAFLTNNGEDNNLRCFSKYGNTTKDCAPVAWRLAFLIARETGSDITTDDLHYAMGLVVNEYPDVEHIIREYGNYKYR